MRRLGGIESFEKKLHSFIVVESVADPKTCKICLSQLTNITSVPNNVQGLLNSMNNSNKNDKTEQFCFDVLSPAETITLSAAVLPADSFSDHEGTKKLLLDTHRCQQSIVSALIKARLSYVTDSIDGDQAWKHQLILGTTHSMVISGNDQALKESLAGAFKIQMNDSGSRKIDPAIIDAKNDNGKTALHYACRRRKNSTVRILVNAGEDCSIAQNVDEFTPCHICAKGLDEKTLSIVLSAWPTRPNPNALDCHGRTPMYLAAVEGKGDIVALDLCLSALAAWGGQLIANLPKSKGLLHPVHCVSAQWKSDKLCIILAHCNHRYPHTNIRNDIDESVGSLSAMFHYPIHALLISFRSRVHSAFQEQYDNSFNAEFTSLKPALIK